ncbi:hypothetical protein NL676_038422 [Syzygium grande]|nr:hypothetical protein NL676_038422 [Syzygium grande]
MPEVDTGMAGQEQPSSGLMKLERSWLSEVGGGPATGAQIGRPILADKTSDHDHKLEEARIAMTMRLMKLKQSWSS